MREYFNQAISLSHLHHPHVVQLLGSCHVAAAVGQPEE
jgi:hypothetical protein